MTDRRPAFTLLELLVVVAVIGVLMAMLLPALQSARESARRMSCGNNLKQLALAVLSYENARGSLPPGSVAHPEWDNVNPNSNWFYTNWGIEILPFIEQEDLYSKYDHAQRFNANIDVITTSLAVQICPSDPLAGELHDVSAMTLRYGSYKGVAGHYEPAGPNEYENDPFGPWSYPGSFSNNTHFARYRGPLYLTGEIDKFSGVVRRPVQMQEIRDGDLHTFLLGEAQSTAPFNQAKWGGSLNQWSLGSVMHDPAARGIVDADWCASLASSNECARAFASHHPDGMTMVFCDGHVLFVVAEVDSNLWTRSGTIAGGGTSEWRF